MPVNLVPAHRISAARRAARRRRWFTIDTAFAVLALSAGAMIVALFDQDGDMLRGQREALSAQVDGENRKIAALRPQIEDARATLEASRVVNVQPDWSLLLGLLSQQQEQKVVLGAYRLEPLDRSGSGRAGSYRLRLEGLGATQTDVSAFVLRLERLALFDRVKVIRTWRQPLEDVEALAFEVYCMFSDSTGGEG